MSKNYMRLISVIADFYNEKADPARLISVGVNERLALGTVASFRDELNISLRTLTATGQWPTEIVNKAMAAAAKNDCLILVESTKPHISLHAHLETITFNHPVHELYVKVYLHPIFAKYLHKLTKRRTCEYCGDTYFYTREEAKFCSPKCQGAAGRVRRKNSSSNL